jgi:hypothetical protein
MVRAQIAIGFADAGAAVKLETLTVEVARAGGEQLPRSGPGRNVGVL